MSHTIYDAKFEQTCTFTTEKSVTFTGACANEIIPSVNRSFVYKAKEGVMLEFAVFNQKQISEKYLDGDGRI
jgi:hypothetical protein